MKPSGERQTEVVNAPVERILLDFAQYEREGGLLPAEDYKRLTAACEKFKDLPENTPTYSQVRNMHTDLEKVRKEEKFTNSTHILYALLREWDKFDRWSPSEDTRHFFQRAADHEIFYEVLKIEGRDEASDAYALWRSKRHRV